VLRVVEPADYAGLTERFNRDSLPDDIAVAPMEILISDIPANARWPIETMRTVDGWKMRDDFSRLKGDTTSLCEFLKWWGTWGDYGPTFDHERSRWSGPVIVPPNWIWFDLDLRRLGTKPGATVHFQDVIGWGLTCNSVEWFRSGYGPVSLVKREEFPHFVIQAFGCEQVILTTITIDRLRDARFRICAREDCRTPFEVKTRHKRDYCTQYCAHLESVRRNRTLNN